jgi:hypothetical protein
MIKAGQHYRNVSDQKYFRVFEVLPDEDKVVVARTKCSSTRLRVKSLSRLNTALAIRQIIPVDIEEKLSMTPAVKGNKGNKANGVFERILPALEALLAPKYFEQAQRKLWPELVREAAKVKVPPSTLNWAYSQVLMAGGELSAACPRWHRCGRNPGHGKCDYPSRPTNQPNSYNLALTDYDKIAAGVRRHLRNEATWGEAFDKFLEEFYPEREKEIAGSTIIQPLPPGQRPSLFQFKWHGLRLVPLQERLVLQFGELEVQWNNRGKPFGQSAPAIYPGVVSEIDWTPPDIVGVARGSRLSIGRFTTYAVADAHSGFIQAAYATMYNGSAIEAGRAILQCLEDKVELCARYGLKIEKSMWDSQWLPIELRSDRGEIYSWKSTGLGTALGIKLEYCASKRPDQKGTIESFFTVLRWCLRRLRGGTSGMRERLKEHPNVTAIYDFDQVQKLLFILAIKFNARIRKRQALTPGMVATNSKPVPNELCKWAQERGCMRDFPIEKARIGVLPTHFASVTAEGIKLKGLRFHVPDFEPTSTDGIDPNDWLMQARKGSWKVEIGIDPSTVNFLWLRHRTRDRRVVELKCPLSAEHEGWRDFSWLEYGLNREEYREGLQNYAETTLRDINAWARGAIAQTHREAAAVTGKARAGMTKTAQIAGTADRRSNEMVVPSLAPKRAPATGVEFFDEAQWGNN